MAITYDSYYETENLFGDPYSELVDFFSTFPKGGKVLDLGCGQGRDAIALARMGFEVTGVDYSRVGIEQMLEIATQRKLSLKGLVADIYRFDEFAGYNFVLFDSMFHFEKKDKEKETALIRRTMEGVDAGCTIVFCIQDMEKKVQVLLETTSRFANFSQHTDISLEYRFRDQESGHESVTPYRLIAIKKQR